MRLLLLAILLAGCGPIGANLDGWDNRAGECDRLDHGGREWPHDVCRSGKGILLRLGFVS